MNTDCMVHPGTDTEKQIQALEAFWWNYFEIQLPPIKLNEDLAEDQCLEYYPDKVSFQKIKSAFIKHLPDVALNIILDEKKISQIFSIEKSYFFIRKNNFSIKSENKISKKILAEQERITLGEILISILTQKLLYDSFPKEGHSILLNRLKNSFVTICVSKIDQPVVKGGRISRKKIKSITIGMSSEPTRHCGFLEKTIL